MNRVQLEEAITKCEKTVRKNFANREFNELWQYVRRERQLHNSETADELAESICNYLEAKGEHYGVKVGLIKTNKQ